MPAPCRALAVLCAFATLPFLGLLRADEKADKAKAEEGFIALFNGKDLAGWKVPEGDNGHWKVVDGVIDYDARSEAKDKNKRDLWTDKSYKDFVLKVDWRLKTEKGFKNRVPIIQADGTDKVDSNGNKETVEIDDVDSGIYLRGAKKSQVNIWLWPIGSGEVYGYRTDTKQSAEVRAAVTPKKKADKARGEWNTFEITMKGDRLWVTLNGAEVISNAQLPDVPKEGPIGLQHHGGFDKDGKALGPPSLVQFKNISIKELK